MPPRERPTHGRVVLRRHPGPALLAGLALTAQLLAGCAQPDYTPPEAGATLAPDARFHGVEDAELQYWAPGPSSDTLLVTFLIGDCSPLTETRVEETPHTVAITLRLGNSGGECLAIGHFVHTVVRLNAPLGDRQVLDDAAGRVLNRAGLPEITPTATS